LAFSTTPSIQPFGFFVQLVNILGIGALPERGNMAGTARGMTVLDKRMPYLDGGFFWRGISLAKSLFGS